MTLPAKSKTNISSQKNILIGCGIGGAAAVIILVITAGVVVIGLSAAFSSKNPRGF